MGRDYVMTETWWLMEMACSSRLEDWQRVGYLGQAKMTATGHAPMGVGEVKAVLQTPDPDTGEVRRAVNVSRAIATAIDRGMLATGSCTRCLVLPHRVENGALKWAVTRKAGGYGPCVHGRQVVTADT